MENKLDFLLSANIGVYNKCEIIEIFGFNKLEKNAFNIYTLIVFEKTKQMEIEGLMTEKLQSFKGQKNISWGIKRRVVGIDSVKKLYIELIEENIYQIDNLLETGQLKSMVEQYVPPRESMHKNVQLNNILKNNFHNGSYILEFFDEEKENVKFLLDDAKLLNSFSENISKKLPIKIGTLSDRLGNIIWQLPINSVEIYHNSIVDRTLNYPKFQGFKIEIIPKIDSFCIKNLLIRIYEDDETISRHKLIQVNNQITEIKFDDSFGTFIEIIDKATQLLLYKFRVYIMKQIYANTILNEQQKRVFQIGEKIEKLQVSTSRGSSIHGKSRNKPFDEWIRDRKYDEELKELEKSKAFVQYFGNENKYNTKELKWSIEYKKLNLLDYKFYFDVLSSSITKAMRDVRELINRYGENGVYLWDPYLSAIDIKNTLYYSKATYIPLKSISGLKQKSSKLDAKNEMIEEFEKDSKQFLFLNLEVRGKIGSHGYDFHDRFLIFPLEKPKVWSLGISVNQLGKSHHILQEVKNAQHILNAFNKLWNELDHEECLIWKSN